MAVASAQAFYTQVVSPFTYGAYGAAAVINQCIPEHCQACAESFAEEPAATYNCMAKCGLCDHLCKVDDSRKITDCELCNIANFYWPSFSLPDRWCVNNCEASKAACVGCSEACAAQGIAFQ